MPREHRILTYTRPYEGKYINSFVLKARIAFFWLKKEDFHVEQSRSDRILDAVHYASLCLHRRKGNKDK
jgi:hypothetical protein